LCLTLGVAGMQAAVLHAEPRVLDPDDYYQFLDVTDPQASPDGTAIAYVVSNNDRAADAAKSTICWSIGTAASAVR
jgi:hypothetical protein